MQAPTYQYIDTPTARKAGRRWFAATALSGIPVALLVAAVSPLLQAALPGIFTWIFLSVAAWAIVAYAQSRVLRDYMPGVSPRTWVVANAVGSALGGWVILIYSAGDPFLRSGTASACLGGVAAFFAGLMITLAQWWVINEHVENAAPWMLASPLGITLGFLAGLYIGWGVVPILSGWNKFLAEFLCLAGVFTVGGALTGRTLSAMLRQKGVDPIR